MAAAYRSHVVRVAILGGGIAGVAAAFELTSRGVDWRVFETTDCVGGLCRSAELDGYTFDIGGVHVLHSRDAETLDFIRSRLGTNSHASERIAGITQGGKRLRFPLGSHLFTLPAAPRSLAAASMLAQRVVAPWRGAPTTLEAWLVETFGSTLYRLHYRPYTEKLWKRHPRDLSVDWLSRIIPPPSLRSFFAATTQKSRPEILHPIRGGIAAFVAALASGLETRILLSTPVEAVEKRGHHLFVNGERFDHVISTLPLNSLSAVCGGLHGRLEPSVKRLRFLSLATLCIATHEQPRFTESWVYIPSIRESPVHRVSCMNNLGATNAVGAGSSLVAEITFSKDAPVRMDREYVRTAIRTLDRAGLLSEAAVRFVEVFIHPHAYVLGDHWYEEARDAAMTAVSEFGIHSLGRFGEHRQVNIDHILRRARDLAAKLASC